MEDASSTYPGQDYCAMYMICAKELFFLTWVYCRNIPHSTAGGSCSLPRHFKLKKELKLETAARLSNSPLSHSGVGGCRIPNSAWAEADQELRFLHLLGFPLELLSEHYYLDMRAHCIQ
jgi:hypothetical protein